MWYNKAVIKITDLDRNNNNFTGGNFMTDILLGVAVAVLIILLIISAVSLILMLKSKNKQDSDIVLKKLSQLEESTAQALENEKQSVSNEIRQSRMEIATSQSEQRKEINATLMQMGEKIEKSSKATYDFSIKSAQTISQSLSQIQKSNDEKLEKIRQTVDERLTTTLTSRLDSSFKTVSDQLDKVYTSLGEMKIISGSVTDNVTTLNRILTNVKSRGTWAEVQLEGLLDQTIPGMYEKNYSPDPLSRQIVEFAVKIPNGDDKSKFTYLPIDSKFPVEDYLRLCDAADAGDTDGVAAARKALQSRVLMQAKEVAKYIKEPYTTPFAILYLATEGLYSEIVSSSDGICERCQSQLGIMIAGPSTLTALLNSISVGFRAFAVNEKAKEIRTLLSAAKAQYEKFGLMLEKAKKKIDEAGKSLDEAQNRNDLIKKKLKTVEEIDTVRADEILQTYSVSDLDE